LTGFSEWARPSWAFLLTNEPLLLAVVALTIVALVIGKDPRTGRRLPPLFDLGCAALGFIFCVGAVRLLPLAAVLFAPLIAERIGARIRSHSAAVDAPVLLLAPLLVATNPLLPLGVGWDTSHLPEGACAYVERESLQGAMYNSMPFGGYLGWRLWPKTRVFMDGRNTLARDASIVDRARRSETDDAAFAGLVAEYDMQWAVVPAFEGAGFAQPLARSAPFAMVYLDDTSAVYVRRDGRNGARAAQGYRWLRHLTSLQVGIAAALSPNAPAAAMDHDGALAVLQAPASPRAAFFDACAAIAMRDAARFDSAVGRLEALRPGHSAISALREAWTAKTR